MKLLRELLEGGSLGGVGWPQDGLERVADGGRAVGLFGALLETGRAVELPGELLEGGNRRAGEGVSRKGPHF